MRLTIDPRDALVVVVPAEMAGFDPTEVLLERRDWIERTLAVFAARRAELQRDAGDLLPDEIAFAATGERWPVCYRPSATSRVSAREVGGVVVVTGGQADAPARRAALVRWLQRAARARLLPMLAEESRRTGVVYAAAGVRGQRGRWAGCSRSGTITLNRALLFLAPELVRATIRHELAHVHHPDHSQAFYLELARLDPEHRLHAETIAACWDALPAWAEPPSADKEMRE